MTDKRVSGDGRPVAGATIDLGLGNVRICGTPGGIADDAPGRTYGAPAGSPALREAVARWQGVQPSEVAITTGASLALVATLCTLPRPASILVPLPYYSAYSRIAGLLGFGLLTYELDAERGWELSTRSVAQSIGGDTAALILNQPHNPTGAVAGATALRRVAELAEARGLLVISDETYAGIAFDGALVPEARSIFARSDLVRVLSFSKLFGMPGERLGFAIADAARLSSIVSAHWSLAMSAPSTAQALALAALRSGPDEHISALVDALSHNRELASEVLSDCAELRYVAPSGGCFLWIEVVDSPLDSPSFMRRCEEVGGVRIVGGHVFGVASPVHVRASLAVPPHELIEGLRRLRQFAASLGRRARTGA